MADLKRDLKASKEQLKIYRRIRKGTLVYTESLHIETAQSGVRDWWHSSKPALLKYRRWSYHDDGFALEFDVLASEDPEPYGPHYQYEYSGKRAEIRGPRYYIAEKIKIVPLGDLPLYIAYRHKTKLFEELLKRGLHVHKKETVPASV
jgi:hypothetical protein